MYKAFRNIGVVLVLVGIVLFLIASIGYSSAKIDPNIQVPAGATVELPRDNPDRLKIEKVAEQYLGVSLGANGLGLFLIIVGVIGQRQQKKKAAEELERLKKQEEVSE